MDLRCLNFAATCLWLFPATLQDAPEPRGSGTLGPPSGPGSDSEPKAVEALGAALKVKHLSKDLQIISTKPKAPDPHGWSQSLSQVLDQYMYRSPAKAEPPPAPAKPPVAKAKKTLGWGNFVFKMVNFKYSLLVTGKIVDHINGTFSVYFRHNSSRLGNLSVSIVPPSQAVSWDVLQPAGGAVATHGQANSRPLLVTEFPPAEAALQGQQQEVMMMELNCRTEYQRTNRSKKYKPCKYDPGQTCYSEDTQTRTSWICSKPFKVICIFIAFTGTDYRLVQKVCPDHNHQLEQQQHFG